MRWLAAAPRSTLEKRCSTRICPLDFCNPQRRGDHGEATDGAAGDGLADYLRSFGGSGLGGIALVGTGVPTLIVQGLADGVVRPSAADHLAAIIEGSIVVRYEGIGHAPHLEDPARFNRDLAEFVGRRARERSRSRWR